MEFFRSAFRKHRQIVLYGIIGASGALLDLVCFLLLFNIFNIDPLTATILSTSLGITNNFILNTLFNFKVRDRLHHRFLLFYLVGFLGLVLSVLVIYTLHNIGGLNANIAKIISIPLIVVIQYYVNSRLSFSSSLDGLIISTKLFVKAYAVDILLLLLAFAVFCLSTFYAVTTDDMDNFLGGKLILNGELPYKDFFTHHMPGMYLLSAVIYPLTGGNPFAYRFIFNIVLFLLIFVCYKVISLKVSRDSARLFVILMTLSHTIALNHVPVAESLVVYAVVLALILIFYETSAFGLKIIAIISALLFAIPFFALSYIFVAIILYIALLAQIIYKKGFTEVSKSFKYIFTCLGLLALPYVIFVFYLLSSNSLNSFIFNNIDFNSTYYGPMVGEEGGSPLKILWNIINGSVGRVALLSQNLFNPLYSIQILIISGFGLLSGLFWMQKKKFLSIVIILLALLLDARVNVFNVPAITGNLEQYALGSIVYLGLALLCASLAIPTILRQRSTVHDPLLVMAVVVAALYLVIIPVNLIKVSAPRLATVSAANIERNYYVFTKNYSANTPSKLINDVLDKNDYAWVGPDGFRDNLYLEPKRSTKFTFFFAWIYECKECRADYLSDLSRQEPKIIYWSGFEYNGRPYYQDVKSYIDSHYFTSKNPHLKGYYFLDSDKSNLTRKLQNHGYKI